MQHLSLFVHMTNLLLDQEIVNRKQKEVKEQHGCKNFFKKKINPLSAQENQKGF